MATTLKIPSFSESNLRERSTLAGPATANSSTITVQSTEGYAVGDRLYIGELSRETCEKAVVAGVTNATTLALVDPLKYAHPLFSAVTSVLGDLIHVDRAVNVDDRPPADEMFSVLATRNIDPDQLTTYYTDSSGSSGYWYRFTYFNASTNQETALSESEPVRGDDFGHYASLSAIRSEAGFENAYNLKDWAVDFQRRAAEVGINSLLANAYKVPFKPVPDAVNVLTVKLAAAMLLVNAYGDTGSYAQQLKDSWAAVQAYADGSSTITDDDGNSTGNTDSISSWPDETAPRSFRIGDRF